MMQVLGDKLTVEQKEAVLLEYSCSTLGYPSVLPMVSCCSAPNGVRPPPRHARCPQLRLRDVSARAASGVTARDSSVLSRDRCGAQVERVLGNARGTPHDDEEPDAERPAIMITKMELPMVLQQLGIFEQV